MSARPLPEWFVPYNAADVSRRCRRLPHREQPCGAYFVTFRLADAVSRETYEHWKSLRDAWVRRHPEPWDASLYRRYHEVVSRRMEQLLDAGYGSCCLDRVTTGQELAQALLHFDGLRYHLDTFVIMPNHVHVLFGLAKTNRLDSVLHSWKSYTAKVILRLNPDMSSPVWLEESFDRIVRSPWHFRKFRNYIEQNPIKANLQANRFILWKSSANDSKWMNRD